MKMMIPSKKHRMLTYLFNFLFRVLVILLFTPFTLQFWHHSLTSFFIIAYLTMWSGAFVYKRMYIPTHEYVVCSDDNLHVLPPFYTWLMHTFITLISVVEGAIMFFKGSDVFSSFFVPFFFLFGAVCWNMVIHTVLEARSEMEIKFRIVSREEMLRRQQGIFSRMFNR